VKLSVGDKAPEFTLLDQDSNTVKLSDFTGTPLVVYFYPAAMTPGCTTEACDFRDRLDRVTSLGYKVVGISPDAPAKLAKFRERDSLNFPLLSDEDHKVADAWGTWGEKQNYGRTYEGLIRSTFVLDEKGVITQALYNVKATGHADRIVKLLSA